MGDDTNLDGAPRLGPWERWWLALLLLASFGLRALSVVQYEASHPSAAHPVIDEASYDIWGAKIAAGDWLGDEVFFQEPLYPYFLGGVYSLFGHHLGAVRLVQCLLGALTVGMVFLLARRLFGRGASWVAGVGMATYGPALLLPCLLLKPNLFLPLLAGFALLLVRPGGGARRWCALGVLGGLGALLRGNMLVLLPALALWAWFSARGDQGRSPGSQRAGGFVLGVALVLLPVLVRNQVVGGVFALTTSGAGTNVYGGNNADNPHGVATEFDWVRGIPRYEAEDWRQEAQRRVGHELTATEVSSYWLKQALASMRRDPALHVGIFWSKLRLALGAYEVPDNHLYEWDRRFVFLLRLPWPGFGVWGSLGLAGLLWWLVSRAEVHGGDRPGVLALLFLLYLGTIVLTVMSSRARLPLVVLLMPFAGLWAARLADLALRRDRSLRVVDGGVLAGSLALAALVVGWPVFDAETLEKDVAEREYNLVVQYVEEGRLAEARGLGQGLAERYPASARLRVLLADLSWREGTLLRDEGQEEAGRAAIRAALVELQALASKEELIPRERSRVFRLAGHVQASLGNHDAAQRFFDRAREFAPRDPELWFAQLRSRVAVCRAKQGEERTTCIDEVRAELARLAEEFEGSATAFEAMALRDALGFGR